MPNPETTGADTIDAVNLGFRIRNTGEFAIHTGRARYSVKCLRCGEVVHEGTTGPLQMARMHLKEKH